MTSRIGSDYLMSTRASETTSIKGLAVAQGSPHNHLHDNNFNRYAWSKFSTHAWFN